MLLELVLVVAITDGDTIKVLDHQNQQHKIRLASIDAPERKQPYGLKSKQILSDLIGKERVTLDCPVSDRYKRLICTIWFNGIDINRKMVVLGGAWVYAKYYKGEDYYVVENDAREAKRGLWSISEYEAIAPWQWRKGTR
jgi:micrococcal nuclease